MTHVQQLDPASTADLRSLLDAFTGEQATPKTRLAVRAAVSQWFTRTHPEHRQWFLLVGEGRNATQLQLELSIPNWKHDCEQCRFLGRWTDGDGSILDLYRCDKQTQRTFIARRSSEGADYESGPVGYTPALAEAVRREAL